MRRSSSTTPTVGGLFSLPCNLLHPVLSVYPNSSTFSWVCSLLLQMLWPSVSRASWRLIQGRSIWTAFPRLIMLTAVFLLSVGWFTILPPFAICSRWKLCCALMQRAAITIKWQSYQVSVRAALVLLLNSDYLMRLQFLSITCFWGGQCRNWAAFASWWRTVCLRLQLKIFELDLSSISLFPFSCMSSLKEPFIIVLLASLLELVIPYASSPGQVPS